MPGQHVAQPGQVAVERVPRPQRQLFTPRPVEQLIGGDHGSGIDHQGRQHTTLPRMTEIENLAAGTRFGVSEHAQLQLHGADPLVSHHSPPPAYRSCAAASRFLARFVHGPPDSLCPTGKRKAGSHTEKGET